MSPVDTSPLQDRLEFARQVKAASNGELLALMQSPRRASIVHDILQDLPAVFRADRAGGLEAVVRWKVTGRSDGGTDTLELVIRQGTLTASLEPTTAPSDADPRRVRLPEDGHRQRGSPKILFLRGRMKARGDLGLATQFPTYFDTQRP